MNRVTTCIDGPVLQVSTRRSVRFSSHFFSTFPQHGASEGKWPVTKGNIMMKNTLFGHWKRRQLPSRKMWDKGFLTAGNIKEDKHEWCKETNSGQTRSGEKVTFLTGWSWVKGCVFALWNQKRRKFHYSSKIINHVVAILWCVPLKLSMLLYVLRHFSQLLI